MSKAYRSTCIAAAVALLAGCTTTQTHVAELRTRASQNIEAETTRSERNVPVVTSTPAAWLLGEAVEVAPAPSPLLDQMVTYSPAQRVSLVDVATWITQQVGVVVDTVEVQTAASSAASAPLPPSSMTAMLQATAIPAHSLPISRVSLGRT